MWIKDCREAEQRYWMYRPIYQIKDKESLGRIKNLEGMKNENAVLWWKYAGRCIKKISLERNSKYNILYIFNRVSQFYVGPVLEKYYREKFMGIALKYCRNENVNTLYETRLYGKILSLFRSKVILK